jgi:hypothetical protein
MIDNFNLIEKLTGHLSENLDPKDYYYHLQVIKRKKDTGEGANSVCIKAYQIDKDHPMSMYREDIIAFCEKFKARAYINVSPKSKKSTAVQMLNNLADCFRQDNFQHINRIWNSAAGQTGSLKKCWLVDCDYSPDLKGDDILSVIDTINLKCQPFANKEKCLCIVPTRNGQHLITQPFNVMEFKKYYPSIDVHKNNPTVLYIPKSIE